MASRRPRRRTRPATPADVQAIRALLAAHDNDGPVVPGSADIVGPYVRHLVAHHRVLVVAEGDDLVAFGAVADTGRCRMLCDLFVHPDRLGQGLGRPLLAALFGDAANRATFASADPRALPLYVRAGMTPLWVNLYLEGLAHRLPDPLSAIGVRSTTSAESSALEGEWQGTPRPADHAYWAAQPAGDAFVILDGAEPVAFGYARARQLGEARAVDRLVVRPGVDPVAPAIAGIVRSARGGPVQVCVPGPSPLLPVLLENGFRVVDQDQYLASDPSIVDPARLLPNPGLL